MLKRLARRLGGWLQAWAGPEVPASLAAPSGLTAFMYRTDTALQRLERADAEHERVLVSEIEQIREMALYLAAYFSELRVFHRYDAVGLGERPIRGEAPESVSGPWLRIDDMTESFSGMDDELLLAPDGRLFRYVTLRRRKEPLHWSALQEYTLDPLPEWAISHLAPPRIAEALERATAHLHLEAERREDELRKRKKQLERRRPLLLRGNR